MASKSVYARKMLDRFDILINLFFNEIFLQFFETFNSNFYCKSGSYWKCIYIIKLIF